MPTLPSVLRQHFQKLNLDSTVIVGLITTREFANTVDQIISAGEEEAARRVALWFQSIDASSTDSSNNESKINDNITVSHYIELSNMIKSNELNSTAAKEIFISMLKTGETPRAIAVRDNLIQVSDTAFISEIVSNVLSEPSSAKAVEDLRQGNEKVIGYLVGQVMKQSRGKANPALATAEIRKQLSL